MQLLHEAHRLSGYKQRRLRVLPDKSIGLGDILPRVSPAVLLLDELALVIHPSETQPLVLDELGRYDVALPLAGLFPERGQWIGDIHLPNLLVPRAAPISPL